MREDEGSEIQRSSADARWYEDGQPREHLFDSLTSRAVARIDFQLQCVDRVDGLTPVPTSFELEEGSDGFDDVRRVLINQNTVTNKRLEEMQDQIIVLDGKIAGLQTEMRQRFAEVDQRFTAIDQRFTEVDGKVVDLQTEMHQHTTMLQQILARLPEGPRQ